ncbi:MAG: transposase [Clostridiales bacterium]|nr:transposase [Clostridiales bacterium]
MYCQYLEDAADQANVQIHAWVLMTNPVHLLATPLNEGALSKMMQGLGRRYVGYFNRHYQRTGTLWEGRFKSSRVDTEEYLLNCQHYIELNPVRAGMVPHPELYCWSSYCAHALGKAIRLWTPHPQYLALGATPTERCEAYRLGLQQTAGLKDIQAQAIRYSLNHEIALGNNRFREEIEHLTGVRQKVHQAGRKKRK